MTSLIIYPISGPHFDKQLNKILQDQNNLQELLLSVTRFLLLRVDRIGQMGQMVSFLARGNDDKLAKYFSIINAG